MGGDVLEWRRVLFERVSASVTLSKQRRRRTRAWSEQANPWIWGLSEGLSKVRGVARVLVRTYGRAFVARVLDRV